jgi:hypothetical protein
MFTGVHYFGHVVGLHALSARAELANMYKRKGKYEENQDKRRGSLNER